MRAGAASKYKKPEIPKDFRLLVQYTLSRETYGLVVAGVDVPLFVAAGMFELVEAGMLPL